MQWIIQLILMILTNQFFKTKGYYGISETVTETYV